LRIYSPVGFQNPIPRFYCSGMEIYSHVAVQFSSYLLNGDKDFRGLLHPYIEPLDNHFIAHPDPPDSFSQLKLIRLIN
jgi:hypothetical protein